MVNNTDRSSNGPAADSASAAGILQECFHKCVQQLNMDVLPLQGAFFLCDPTGRLLDCYPLGKADLLASDFGLLEQGAIWSSATIGLNGIGKSMETLQIEAVKGQQHTLPLLREYVTVGAPVLGTIGKLYAVIGWAGAAATERDAVMLSANLALLFNSYFIIIRERNARKKLEFNHLQFEKEAKKTDILFQVAKKVHAKIDVNSVITEVINNLHDIYPSIQIDLYLSQDNKNTNLPVKPLTFQGDGTDMCTRAFMEGQMITEALEASEEGYCYRSVAAPLCGKQGVYGVLHLFADHNCFDEMDTRFISMIADTAGTAFENARLYEQSNMLIVELRLINEITKSLNQSLKLNEIFQYATRELLEIFAADYCCILQLDPVSNQLAIQASNLPSMSQEAFSLDYGFAGLAFETREAIIISDYWKNRRVSSMMMEVTDSRSLIASPILVGSQAIGAVLVCHKDANFFSYENYKLLQVLSGHIGLAMTNASLHAEVRRMVITDNLTGLFVRHYLDEQVNIQQKKDFCGSLIVVDIDDFKMVNDTYGHQVGDKTLIQVSNIIRTSIRETDIAARWGGEELAIYLPQVNIEQTTRIGERIRKRVAEETHPHVTVSCGISDWNWEDEKISVESLFYKADMALYEAKHGGKNQIKVR